MRASAGITLQASCESILSDVGVTQDIRSGVLSSKELASRGASQRRRLTSSSFNVGLMDLHDNDSPVVLFKKPKKETWEILCISKFDSERKKRGVSV